MKKGPANKTDTSFTSKKVVIRAQNIKSTGPSSGNDETGVITKIKAILPNCGHYNGNMRKDATLNVLKCLKELENLNSATFLTVLDPIFVASFRQVCDEEVNVRSAFLGLLTFLFENLKKENLASFFPRWISFLNLASSHIKPEIRKDSVRFIGITLKTQKSLFIPYLHNLLPTLVPLLTQYPQRPGTVPAFDCTLNLIDAYLEPFLTKKEADELAKPLISYVWQIKTVQPQINLIRNSPFVSSQGSLASNPKPQPIPDSALFSIISHLGNLSISLFLDTIHLLNKSSNHTNTVGKNTTEFRQLQDVLSLYRKLFSLAKFAGGDEELFWKAMPVKLVKNYKDKLIAE